MIPMARLVKMEIKFDPIVVEKMDKNHLKIGLNFRPLGLRRATEDDWIIDKVQILHLSITIKMNYFRRRHWNL